MKEARYFYVPDLENSNELTEGEAVHAIRVLRMKNGEEIFLLDGKGHVATAEVALVTSKHCMFSIKEIKEEHKSWHGNISLAIAPTKMLDRIEWMAEKATEIGFDKLAFLDCHFSERKVLKTERIEKIVISAVKQSRKAWMPRIEGMVPCMDFIKQSRQGRKYIAHCYDQFERKDLFEELSKRAVDEDITVMIGPEGDFSVGEVETAIRAGYESVSLGKSRLRTETAGLYAVMAAQLSLREK